MGVKKGTDNFSSYRNIRSEKNVLLIQFELNKQSKRRIQYPDFSALLNHISEKTGIHRTTISRNPTYKRLLLTYLSHQPGATGLLKDDDSSPDVLKAKLFDARLELRNLRNQYNILIKQKNHLTKISTEKLSGAPVELIGEDDWYPAFNDASRITMELIERMNAYGETVKIDLKKRQIIDLSKSGSDRIIAEGIRVKQFIEFYEAFTRQTNQKNAISRVVKKGNKE